MIKTVTEKITRYASPDGKLHDTQVEAEIHHLKLTIEPLFMGDEALDGTTDDFDRMLRVLVANKVTIGPLLRVPVTRPRKTAEEKAKIQADKDAAAKAKKDSAKKSNRPGGQPA
jgi:hypothetical protein